MPYWSLFAGLNVQHDANHGAVSRNPKVNRLLGLTQSWIGGSSVSWLHQHVVQHHVHTNDIHLDPDMTSDPGPLRQAFLFASITIATVAITR